MNPSEGREADEGILGAPVYSRSGVQPLTVTVGLGAADIPGDTNVCIQAAVDYVSGLGGGVVALQPGRYHMLDSLHMRPNVKVCGSGRDTVLVKPPMVESRLSTPFLGYGHFDLSLADPDGFRVGMGVCIGGPGFHATCATLTFRDGDRFGISRPLNADCLADDVVRSIYPLVSGYHAVDCVLEGFSIEGDSQHNELINGCRGAGVFLLGCHRATIRGVTVEDFSGDGFSVQQSDDVLIEDCAALGNRGHGFHPGSGSARTTLRRVQAVGNAGDGVFYCLRATFGMLEDSLIDGSGGNGLNIGQRDSYNTVRTCRISGCRGSGIEFRPVDDPALAPVGTLVEGCTIAGNARSGGAEVRLTDHVRGTTLRANRIGPGANALEEWTGVWIEAGVSGLTMESNTVEGPQERAIVDLRR